MAFSVHIEKFEGPLDLLLQLVESQEMEITALSLMEVTEPFVQQVRDNQGKIPPEDLADFLVVAAKLIYLKSKALLPGLNDPSLEEGPDLETQLRMYKAFLEAANRLGEIDRAARRSYNRARPSVRVAQAGFVAPRGLTVDGLQDIYRQIVRRIEPIVALPKAALARAVTIEEKIQELTGRLGRALRMSFQRFLSESRDRSEMVVSFLALLELIKQRVVKVNQTGLFEEINLEASEVRPSNV